MTRADVKALQALEAMKLCHDFDSTMSVKSLATIRKHYSIPTEYVLHAPTPWQRPYHTCPEGFNISIDAWEVGLRFPLHPEIPPEEATRKMPEVSGKRPVEVPSGQWKKAKVLGWHKSRHEDYSVDKFHLGLTSPSLVFANALTRLLPWQSHHYYMTLFDRVHDFGRVIIALDNKSDVLQKEVQKLKAGGDPDTVVVVEQWGSEAQPLVDCLKNELEEVTR
ncbi:hypothetical protein B296_00016294 [Ensete ventricosum]|uniref:Uncharacterized protein n=1 Tax=Ensete ventricosum TaxID=4639 RepID=A0A426ZUB2_ENSVE|nr:hypothetical protein B296_00016294 [Ensete ventricosum]